MAPSRSNKTKNARSNPISSASLKNDKPKSKPKSYSEWESENEDSVKDRIEIANELPTQTLQGDLNKFLRTPPDNKVGDSPLVWRVYKGPELKATPQKDNVWALFEVNMRDIYIKANDPYLKWSPAKKKRELYHTNSRYILLETEDHSQLAAFCMFRFEAEANHEGTVESVTYIYEIQVSKDFQGSGIYRRIFDALEQLSAQYQVQLIMLTVFKCNPLAIAAYRHLGYNDHVDTTDTAFVLFKNIK